MHKHFEETPSIATFPSFYPLFALDRLWVKPRRLLKRIEVHATARARMASDHLPLKAELDLHCGRHDAEGRAHPFAETSPLHASRSFYPKARTLERDY
jgi:hypothetical protein